jgi:hypothetical protein
MARKIVMIHLHVGQCGNGIGKALAEHPAGEPRGPRSLSSFQQSSIFVDSEPRVVRQFDTTHAHAPYSSSSSSSLSLDQSSTRSSSARRGKPLHTASHHENSGSGNNWALGYFSEPSSRLFRKTMDSLRRQVECQDVFYGVQLFHSLSGGTGTGLSSRLATAIRDAYGDDPYLLSTCVAPFDIGDTPLQHYNAVLTLGAIQPACDALIWSSNAEMLSKHCDSLSGINQEIARCHFAQVADVRPLMRNVAAIPSCNVVEVCAADTLEQLVRKVPRPLGGTVDARSIQCQLVAQGASLRRYKRKEEPLFSDKEHKSILRMCKPVAWNHDALTIIERTKEAKKSKRKESVKPKRTITAASDSTVSVAMNRARINEYLSRVIARAEEMFDARAYWHWYAQCGCDELMLMDSLERLRVLRDNYTKLSA